MGWLAPWLHKARRNMDPETAHSLSFLLAAATLAVGMPASATESGFSATYLYDLVSDTGTTGMAWPSMSWDDQHEELYVVDPRGVVQVFNQVGMPIFAFGDDGKYGRPIAAAPVPTGDVMVLDHGLGGWALVRYSYRGEPLEKIELMGLPSEFAEDFTPDAMQVVGRELFLADTGAMKLAVVGLDGEVSRIQDVAQQLKGQGTEAVGMRGFGVDRRGNVLFTVPTQFIACVLSPAGELRSFGTRGSTAGKFNVISGITADEENRIYVADGLRGVVSVWSPDLTWLGELGGRGTHPGNLRSPFHLVAANSRVYVSQSIGGVKVFGVRIQE